MFCTRANSLLAKKPIRFRGEDNTLVSSRPVSFSQFYFLLVNRNCVGDEKTNLYGL